MPIETKVKIKNDEPTGASLRLQFWNGKLPTYDSEGQKARAAEAGTFAVDGAGAPEVFADGAESLPEGYDKLKKAELVELAQARKDAGKEITLDEADTVAVLREKIEATYPAPTEAKAKVAAQNVAAAESVAPDYEFSASNLLQEITLATGEEKVFGLTSEHFITIKIDA